jgi:two-component system, OmpR family, phosphate regulon sensor histidine kinase PhoR
VSPIGVLAIVGLALLGVAFGRALDGALPWVWTLLVSISAVAIVQADVARRIGKLTTGASSWLASRGFDPLPVRGRGAWGQHAIVLNALGAAHERRGVKLSRERPWRRQLVDALVDPALLFSGEGRLLAANDAARELFGIPIDADDITVVQAVGSAALVGAVREVQATGHAVTVDTEHGDHDLRAVVSQVGDEALLLVNDRTRERRVEDLRRNFVVNASHELKTPVTAIRTLSEALAVTATSAPERVPSLLKRLDLESDRLARLVYDLLDLRRLEERGPLERVPVDIAELARRTVAAATEQADEREIELSVDAPDHAYVAGVPGDLAVIVKNLVGNAIQYNRAGGQVEVGVRQENGSQVVSVRDTGIGIPQQDLVRVFERFYRVDTARSRETGGTGLGLSIVRHAVESHGGTIRVDSLLGEGTTFTVTLPIESASG